MKRILAILTFLVMGTSTAQAGIMIEPFVSYGLSGELDANTNIGVKGDLSFMSFGGRIAYKMLGFFVGGEYAIYNEAEITSTGTSTGTFKYAMNGISVIAGYDLPILFRVYGGYTLSYTGTITGAAERKVDSGTGYFVGVGYSLIPMVSLNVEYRTHNLDETTLNGTSSTFTDAKDTQIMVGVSVPLGIPFL